MAEFVIKLRDLEAGERSYRFELTSSWLEKALEGTELRTAGETGHARLVASPSGRDVLVRGEVAVRVEASCGRCLGPAVVSISAPMTVLFTPDRPPLHGDGEGDEPIDVGADDLDREHFSGETIELDDLVRDQILVEVPFSPLCRDDCPGIAPAPRAEIPAARDVIDPRFAPLLGIKLSNKDKE